METKQRPNSINTNNNIDTPNLNELTGNTTLLTLHMMNEP